MQLLALLYAFLAGLAGLSPAHAVARADAVLGQSLAQAAEDVVGGGQVVRSAHAFLLRASVPQTVPSQPPAAGYRLAIAVRTLPLPVARRAVPERRRE